MYAIIEVGSKQYQVNVGSIVYSELLGANEGDNLDFKVLALGGDGEFKFGRPY